VNALVLLNPASRGGRGRRVWRVLDGEPGLRRVVSSDPDELRARAAADDAPLLVAVGGDGTINLALDAAMRRTPRPRVGILYAGTSPDFCRFHRVPLDPRAAWDALRRGSPARPIDLCRVDPLSPSQPSRPSGPSRPSRPSAAAWFACAANIGLGPAVAAAANRLRPRLGDALGTFAALLGALRRARRFDARLAFDDGSRADLRGLLHLAVLKSDAIASGIRLGVPAAPCDGFLHVVAAPRLRAADLPRIYRGGLPRGAFVRRARSVAIETDPPLPLEWDGDPAPLRTPVRVTCERAALEILP
jgi:diacylglycerol kinase (ATP)